MSRLDTLRRSLQDRVALLEAKQQLYARPHRAPAASPAAAPPPPPHDSRFSAVPTHPPPPAPPSPSASAAASQLGSPPSPVLPITIEHPPAPSPLGRSPPAKKTRLEEAEGAKGGGGGGCARRLSGMPTVRAAAACSSAVDTGQLGGQPGVRSTAHRGYASDGEDEATSNERLWQGAHATGWRVHARAGGHYVYIAPDGCRYSSRAAALAAAGEAAESGSHGEAAESGSEDESGGSHDTTERKKTTRLRRIRLFRGRGFRSSAIKTLAVDRWTANMERIKKIAVPHFLTLEQARQLVPTRDTNPKLVS